MKNVSIILILLVTVLGCSESDDPINTDKANATKVIFGQVYGMCTGDCRNLYMINSSGLYKDGDREADEYGKWSNTTFEEELSAEDFEKASELLNIPSSLLKGEIQEKDMVQAWADIDYYIYVEKNGVSKEIILDEIHPDADPEIKAYFRKFVKNYEELGGYIIDTTGIHRYY